VVLGKKIFKWPTPFLHFSDYLPFEKDLALDLYIVEFPLPKDDLWQVWVKLACWIWRRFFLKFSKFLLFCYYLLLGKGVVLQLYNSELPLPKNDWCQLWLKFDQQFWRSRKCKSLTDRQTDAQRAIRKTHLSFQLRWAKKNYGRHGSAANRHKCDKGSSPDYILFLFNI
jgi:hypothetical protein